MPLSNPRIVYGVHSITPYRRDTGLPYGTALVLGQSNFSLSGELASLFGGSNKYPWAVEETTIAAELSIAVKQYENWMFEVFLGKGPTIAGSSTGAVTALTDKKGILVNATWGIDSIGVKSGSEADLKFSKYIIKVDDAATDAVHVYALSNVDFARGTDADFFDDALRVTDTPLIVPSGTTVEIPGFGLEITGGTAVDFAGNSVADGDTATFEVLPPSSASTNTRIGSTTDVFPEFGCLVLAQQRGSGEMYELDIFRLKGVGLPMGFQEKAFSEAEITAQAFYDSAKNGVFDIRTVVPE